jgi:hypothetical protein
MAQDTKPGNRWLRWLKRERTDAGAQPRIEVESYSARAVSPAGGQGLIVCPACDARTGVSGYTCAQCGFPLVCDIAPTPAQRPAQRWRTFRQYLGVAAALLWLLGSTLLLQGNDAFNGLTTDAVNQIHPATSSGIEISGPQQYVERTQLALGLLQSRAPDYYFRMRESVVRIDYLNRSFLEGPAGRKIKLEGIGAVSTPEQRLVQVLYITAFPSGVENLYDRDVFLYAGVLVHELRHIELHQMGAAPGGWQEEVLCEKAAYDALQHMGAPQGVLLRYELYFRDPLARSYQRWYKWYDQFE